MWTPERVWKAVDEWRWMPAGARQVRTPGYDLAVTPGSFSLTSIYGFRADSGETTDRQLAEIRQKVESLGGTGARFYLTPLSQPANLAEHLLRAGYQVRYEADILVWELRDAAGNERFPNFPTPDGVSVREIESEADYGVYLDLSSPIFGDPPASPDSRAALTAEFHRLRARNGHSNCYLAWKGPEAVGRGGMDVVGPVARLWATGVLPKHRRQGVYGALVRARLVNALALGAEIALVTAVTGTSGPILRRRGFRPMGTVQTYEIRW